jgi:hypothetical protein
MDWATAAIEAVGLLILGIWIVIPIHEFQQILARIRQSESSPQPPTSPDDPSRSNPNAS